MISALIGAGSSLLGGLFSGNSQKKMAREQMQLQREFAQNGVQWKVADAKKAGIAPLAALGAQTHSYTPISYADPMGDAISNAGQNIAGAVQRGQSSPEKQFIQKTQALTLQRQELENQLLASQIAQQNQPANQGLGQRHGQTYFIDGQGNAPSSVPNTDMVNLEVTKPGHKSHIDPYALNDVGHVRTSNGGYAPVMSADAKDRLEEDIVGNVLWSVRNRLLPYLYNKSGEHYSTPYPAPAGQKWHFDDDFQYRLKRRKGSNDRSGGSGW